VASSESAAVASDTTLGLRANVIVGYDFRVTLMLFRTRRRDECSRLKEGERRRLRKSTSVNRQVSTETVNEAIKTVSVTENGLLRILRCMEQDG
jgi:hypothetical protein